MDNKSGASQLLAVICGLCRPGDEVFAQLGRGERNIHLDVHCGGTLVIGEAVFTDGKGAVMGEEFVLADIQAFLHVEG